MKPLYMLKALTPDASAALEKAGISRRKTSNGDYWMFGKA